MDEIERKLQRLSAALTARHSSNKPSSVTGENGISTVTANATIASLPQDVLRYVFQFLGPYDLAVSARVCRPWRTLANDPQSWQTLPVAELCDAVDDVVALWLQKSHGTLRALSLLNCANVTSVVLAMLATQVPLLEALDLNLELNEAPFNVSHLETFLGASGATLTVLRIAAQDMSAFDDSMLARAVTCPRLRALALASLADLGLSEECFERLPSRHADLRELELTGTSFTGHALPALVAAFPNLTSLTLGRKFSTWPDFSDDDLRDLHVLALRSLHLKTPASLTDRGMAQLALFPNLTSLSIASAYRISSMGVEAAMEAVGAQLRLLSFSSCGNLDDEALWSVAQHCHRLTALDISQCQFSDRAIGQILEQCLHVGSLNLAYITRLGRPALEEIAFHAKQLRYLNLFECGLTDDDKHFVRMWLPHAFVL